LNARPNRAPVRFTPATLAFLRGLKRHNTREWFLAHRDAYELQVRAPMVAFVERLAVDFRGFAPELLATPRASIFRIYRDTRFSADKTPYKTHVSAYFQHRALPRMEGAGLYLEIAPARVLAAGGIHAPSGPELLRIRQRIADDPGRFEAIVTAPRFLRTVGPIDGDRLQRTPRGFPKDHPAAEWLRFRQFIAGVELPAAQAAAPGFYARVLSLFRAMMPLVRFLNEPLVEADAGTAPSATPAAARRREVDHS
jgi:uncharacterized protein (TIGR02453 family)